MSARTYSVTLEDGKTSLIEVQCNLERGMTAFKIEGMPLDVTSAIRNRIRATINSMGLSLPAKQITVMVPLVDSPDGILQFDLPIAVSLLAAMNIIPRDDAERHVCLGGLSEGGNLVPISRALLAAIAASEKNFDLVCPNDCGAEAAWIGSIQVIAPKTLLELVNHFNGRRVLSVAEFGDQLEKAQRLPECPSSE